jgi:hypothetical protein
MKRFLVAAIALGMGAFVAPAAHADGSNVIHGGCNFRTVQNVNNFSDAEYDGIIGDLSVTNDATGAPIGATVTCWLEVNDVEAPGTRFSYTGFGVQVGSDQISYVADDGDWISECRAVTYADGTTEPTECRGLTVTQIPPECPLGTCDLVGTVNRLFISTIDPAACPVLVSVAGSYPGGVTIAPDGDVYVPDPFQLGINPIYDCPPYLNY